MSTDYRLQVKIATNGPFHSHTNCLAIVEINGPGILYCEQGLSQRPVQPSFGRPIFSLDVEKYRQIPPNSIVGGPQTPSWPNNKSIWTPFYHLLAKSMIVNVVNLQPNPTPFK